MSLAKEYTCILVWTIRSEQHSVDNTVRTTQCGQHSQNDTVWTTRSEQHSVDNTVRTTQCGQHGQNNTVWTTRSEQLWTTRSERDSVDNTVRTTQCRQHSRNNTVDDFSCYQKGFVMFSKFYLRRSLVT